jgi:hypothetical protein
VAKAREAQNSMKALYAPPVAASAQAASRAEMPVRPTTVRNAKESAEEASPRKSFERL